MGIFETLAKDNSNQVVAILASLVMVLSGIIVYLHKTTVPKWIYDGVTSKIEQILDIVNKMATVIDERIKK